MFTRLGFVCGFHDQLNLFKLCIMVDDGACFLNHGSERKVDIVELKVVVLGLAMVEQVHHQILHQHRVRFH
jgi:hypothetical protein